MAFYAEAEVALAKTAAETAGEEERSIICVYIYMYISISLSLYIYIYMYIY